MDRALLALLALLVNALLGGPKKWYDAAGVNRVLRLPVSWLRDIERRLNREHRSLSERRMRGLILLAAVVMGCVLLGWLGNALFRSDLNFIELTLLALLLPVRPGWDIASAIARFVQAGDLAAARQQLEGTAWRHHALLDEHGLCRAAIEILAIHFSERILAGVFWYLIFGLPGLFIVASVNLMRDHLSPPVSQEEGFSEAAYTLHMLAQYLPSRVAAVLWIAVSLFLPSGKWREAFQAIQAAFLSASPRRLALLAAGSVLTLSLGGPTSIYAGGVWIGTGTSRTTPADVRRALYLFALLHLLLFVGLGLLL